MNNGYFVPLTVSMHGAHAHRGELTGSWCKTEQEHQQTNQDYHDAGSPELEELVGKFNEDL